MKIGTFLPYLLICAVCACLFLAGKGTSRRGEEHGSARWGTAFGLCRKYGDTDKVGNKVLTQNVRIGLDSRKHLRNLNILVCGGSGSGKTRSFAKANIMSSDKNSLVILDPKAI